MNAIMRIVPSSWKQGEPIEKQSLLVQNESELAHHIETGLINIYSDYTHQTIEGYGCALTESACFLLSQMDDELEKKRWAVGLDQTELILPLIRIAIWTSMRLFSGRN